MKKSTQFIAIMVAIFLSAGMQLNAQTTTTNNSTNQNDKEMKTYVIEREIPGAGDLTPEELKAIAQKSCAVVSSIGPDIVWIHSYVTENKLYCIYQATSPELIYEHAEMGNFPANSVAEVATMFSPATATE